MKEKCMTAVNLLLVFKTIGILLWFAILAVIGYMLYCVWKELGDE